MITSSFNPQRPSQVTQVKGTSVKLARFVMTSEVENIALTWSVFWKLRGCDGIDFAMRRTTGKSLKG
jgi:hypothetical protein